MRPFVVLCACALTVVAVAAEPRAFNASRVLTPTAAGLDERIDAFAQRVLSNAAPGSARYYSAAVFAGAPAGPTGTDDPYIVRAASIKRLLDDDDAFLAGGTDTDGITHVVVVMPSKTPRAPEAPAAIRDVARAAGMTVEHHTAGVIRAPDAQPARASRTARCLTLGRRCRCSNKCKCTGDNRTLICSCTKWLWWACDCPASNRCTCGSLWINGNFCKKA